MTDSDTTVMEDWRVWDRSKLSPLNSAILECFVRDGYHAATTRSIAHATGLSVPGLYHHYPSKHAMLESLMNFGMEELRSHTIAALASVGDAPRDRLRALVECLVLFNAQRSELAFLSTSELRSLEPDARAVQVKARERQQSLFIQAIEDGVAQGVFTTPTPRDAARAITTMCIAVIQWYRPNGSKSPEEIAAIYAAFAERIVGIDTHD
jgi:AcrR family transcriptional regulator